MVDETDRGLIRQPAEKGRADTGNAEGEVKALLDWRGAAVIGAVAGVVLFLLSLLGRSRRA